MKTKKHQTAFDISPPVVTSFIKSLQIKNMKKSILFIITASFIFNNANSQITKGYWLISGNANFSTLKSSSAASLQFKQTDIQISSGVGYFPIDKFAIGLRPSFTYGNNSINAGSAKIFGIGPFLRYYFLKPEKVFNVFTEANYSYQSIVGQGSGQKSNTFSFLAGPVLYFNTSVGLEFTMGYSTTKIVGFTGSNNKMQFGIGFQFHLEKEK
jgi:hypothetical protein